MAEPAQPAELEHYRGYLRALAIGQLAGRLQAKLDASDIVQQTLLRATAGWDDLRDRRPEALAAWLRQILSRELIDAVRRFQRDRRDVAGERQIAHELDQSAAGLERGFVPVPAADQTSPSAAAGRNEQALQLADALMELPDDQRQAVILKHLQGMTLDQIATATARTPASVAGLLRRGLANLRTRLDP